MFIHRFIHRLWITTEEYISWDGCEADMGVLQTL
jgi:hypothetical protein